MNIIYDAFGSSNTSAVLWQLLRDAGARIVTFNPLDPLHATASPNHRDHRKIMVVDGRVGFTGGINLDKAYQNPPSAGVPPDGDMAHAYWRDTAVRIEGPAVAELQKVFFGTWHEQKAPAVVPARYFPPLLRAGDETVRIIASAPGDERPLYFISLMTAGRPERHAPRVAVQRLFRAATRRTRGSRSYRAAGRAESAPAFVAYMADRCTYHAICPRCGGKPRA